MGEYKRTGKKMGGGMNIRSHRGGEEECKDEARGEITWLRSTATLQ